jgi:hypothetical protein
LQQLSGSGNFDRFADLAQAALKPASSALSR